METLWFCLLGWVLATYVVLDGFDLGAGVCHLFVARTPAERRQVLASVGPVWDGNEVWLIVAGGTMFAAFPKLLATAFSGFYLPLMIVLWLLVFRALAIELHHHVASRLWTQFWDVAFAGSSALLIICLGAALGNVVRGVSLDESGSFFAPLWTDLRVGADTGILDWYTLLVAATALLALTHHGALWILAKTDGPVAERAQALAARLLLPLLLAVLVLTGVSFSVQPLTLEHLNLRPWGAVFPILALAGLAASHRWRCTGRYFAAFLGSGAFLYGLLASAAVGLFPYVLPARDPIHGLTVTDVAVRTDTLSTTLTWWLPGMALACAYVVIVFRSMPATYHVDDEAH